MVTGANRGIGKAVALGLARQGARVVMVSRDAARGHEALNEVRASAHGPEPELRVADLGDLSSVRAMAEAFRGDHRRLDVLVNNAAVLPAERIETADGFEAQFAVNHLAHFLLTNLLLEPLASAGRSRVINVTSGSHFDGRIDFGDLQARAGYDRLRAYRQSKLANVLFTYELHRRHNSDGIDTNAVHPGVVDTELLRRWLGPFGAVSRFVRGPAAGAAPIISLAADRALEGVSGKFFDRMREGPSAPASYDEETARRLWDVSARLTGLG